MIHQSSTDTETTTSPAAAPAPGTDPGSDHGTDHGTDPGADPGSGHGSGQGAAPAAAPQAKLPFVRFLVAIAVAGTAVTVAWIGITIALGQPTDIVTIGPIAVGVVAGAGVLALLALTPWKTRALDVWPLLWTLAGFGRMLVVLVVGGLLYSRPQIAGIPLVIAIGAAYLSILAAETHILARWLHGFAAPGPAATDTLSTPGSDRSETPRDAAVRR